MTKVLANGKKATNAQIEERVTTVYGLLIRGATQEDILQHAAATWGLSVRQSRDYLARATQRFRDLATWVREEELGRARAQLHDLYGRNMKTQDYKAAHAVRKDLSELLDLYPEKTTHHEHSGPDGGPVALLHLRADMDPAELERRLRDELERGEEAEDRPLPLPGPPSTD